MPKILKETGRIDIFHANAGSYIGGDLVDNDPDAIDRMLNLNINVVMKNVRAALSHMIKRKTGDIIVTSSLAGQYPTPWEPVYAPSKWAVDGFVQITRRQVFQHGIRVGSISPGPVETALVADWPCQETEGSQGFGSLAQSQGSGERDHVHADAARAT